MDEFKNNENQNPDIDSIEIGEQAEQMETIEITEVADEPTTGSKIKKELLDWTVSIVVAILIALVIRTYVFTLVKVDGASMNPTLSHGDTLYTNRFFYKPDNGDIVIFKPAHSPDTPYVKRVIATEGQTVDIDSRNRVIVDGKVLNEHYIKEPMRSAGQMQYPCTVPEGHIFVLGDNRNNSMDSRNPSVGFVAHSDIIGKATFRLLPISGFGSLY